MIKLLSIVSLNTLYGCVRGMKNEHSIRSTMSKVQDRLLALLFSHSMILTAYVVCFMKRFISRRQRGGQQGAGNPIGANTHETPSSIKSFIRKIHDIKEGISHAPSATIESRRLQAAEGDWATTLDINGNKAGDLAGSALAANDIFTIVAVGLPGADLGASSVGVVRIYQRDGSNWSRLGSDLHGINGGNQFGCILDLESEDWSPDSRVRLAVSANDYVQVYEYDKDPANAGDWVIIGNITTDSSVASVSLCNEVIAIGTAGHANDIEEAYVYHTRLNASDHVVGWDSVGNFTGSEPGDLFGYSVSLMDWNCYMLAIGAPGLNGSVSTHQWDEETITTGSRRQAAQSPKQTPAILLGVPLP